MPLGKSNPEKLNLCFAIILPMYITLSEKKLDLSFAIMLLLPYVNRS